MVRSDRITSTVADVAGAVLSFIRALLVAGVNSLRDATLWFVPVVAVLALLYPQPQLFTQPISHLTLAVLVPHFAPPAPSSGDTELYLRLVFKVLFWGLWAFRAFGAFDEAMSRRVLIG